jgi:hypothetical protein
MSQGRRLGTEPLAACQGRVWQARRRSASACPGTKAQSVRDNRATPGSGTQVPIHIARRGLLANPLTASSPLDHAHFGIGRSEGAPSFDADRKTEGGGYGRHRWLEAGPNWSPPRAVLQESWHPDKLGAKRWDRVHRRGAVRSWSCFGPDFCTRLAHDSDSDPFKRQRAQWNHADWNDARIGLQGAGGGQGTSPDISGKRRRHRISSRCRSRARAQLVALCGRLRAGGALGGGECRRCAAAQCGKQVDARRSHGGQRLSR